MRDIGKNIKELRQRKNMTQDELAEKLFVTRQTVSNYETGKSRPDIEMLARIAEMLDTDANTVLYGIPEQSGRYRKYLRLGITVAVTVLLFIGYRYLSRLGAELHKYSYDSRLRLVCLFLLDPLVAFSFGWTAVELLSAFVKLSPLSPAWRKRLRLTVLGTAAVLWMFLLPVFLEYTFWAMPDWLPNWFWEIWVPPAMWLVGAYPTMQGKPGVLIMGILGCVLWLGCYRNKSEDIKK